MYILNNGVKVGQVVVRGAYGSGVWKQERGGRDSSFFQQMITYNLAFFILKYKNVHSKEKIKNNKIKWCVYL